MEANKLGVGRGWSWVVCGSSLVKRDLLTWVVTGAAFALIASVLLLLPFVGRLLLILIAPVLVVGTLRAAREQAHNSASAPAAGLAPSPAGGQLARSAAEAMARLFRGFGDPTILMQMLVLGTLALGVVVILEIFAQLFRVGPQLLTTLPAAMASGAAAAGMLGSLLALLLLLTLQVALWMAVLFAVPLVGLDNEMPITSIQGSFRACLKNWAPLTVFGIVFSVAWSLLGALWALHWTIGYLGLFTIGSLLFALFVTSVFCAYREIFVRSTD
jgi:hypothetical protein